MTTDPRTDPRTDPDPQPGDFDADLAAIAPRYVEAHPPNPDAKLTIVVGIEEGQAIPNPSAAGSSN